jgi:acyl CoA:acetate/3-ketoacid CoA transferase
MSRTRVITGREAVELIADGATVAVQGSGGCVAEPTDLLRHIGAGFVETGRPKGLTMVHATGLGDRDRLGLDLLAYPGLIKRDIAGHLGMAPKIAGLIYRDQIESYNFPQGVISHLFVAIAGRKPGVITKVGLGTFVDPRVEGGKVNASARDDLVQVLELAGEEWLFYPAFPIDVALIRGTTADERGNITMEHEAAILEGISIAQAAKASGGIVIAQVKYLARAGTLDARDVRVPGVCVDYVCVDPEQKQTTLEDYNPSFSGARRIPLERLPILPLDAKKVIGRRASQELFEGAVVNLGVGVPSTIANVAAETGMIEKITFTVEQGIVGGMPAGGVIFGVAYNPEAIIAESDQFTFYDGGGLDLAFLGMAQIDRAGNVNVSKVGPMLTGCGGFINISQNAGKVVFCGTFTTKGFECEVGGGRLKILREGKIRKLVPEVAQITFSGAYARKQQRPVLYVTERAVFELVPEGVVLREIAPGVDLEKDVLGRMDFAPLVPARPATMSEELFR